MSVRTLTIERRAYAVRGAFRIARGAKTAAEQIIATISDGAHIGRGACVPYGRYGETLDSVEASIESVRAEMEAGIDRETLARLLPAGAARNALDCALWDFEAKSSGHPVRALAGLPSPMATETCYTLSVDTPDAVADAARSAPSTLFKLKLAGDGADIERVAAANDAVSGARFVLDANEGLDAAGLDHLLAALDPFQVLMIEQPLPADNDLALGDISSPIPLCADEAFHTAEDVARLRDRYQAVNVKLDKTGGLTEAIAAVTAARAAGLQVMIGCMLGSSLAMAPAALLAPLSDVVDLDGPLLLAEDDAPAIAFDGALMAPPPPALWG